MLSNIEKKWGMYCHIAALAGYVFPLGNIIAPLVIWVMKKDECHFVDDQGKEVLNFQITAVLAFFISAMFAMVYIGFVLMIAIGIAVLFFTVKGVIRTSEGYAYRYPFSIKFIK